MNHQQFYKYVTQRLYPTSHSLSLVSDGISLDSPQEVFQCLSFEFSNNFTATTNGYNSPVLVSTAAAGPQLELINMDTTLVLKLFLKQGS